MECLDVVQSFKHTVKFCCYVFGTYVNVPSMSLFLQLELEQQKNEEEQENTPEFVKMKSNLRRTKQEADGEERTT